MKAGGVSWLSRKEERGGAWEGGEGKKKEEGKEEKGDIKHKLIQI